MRKDSGYMPYVGQRPCPGWIVLAAMLVMLGLSRASHAQQGPGVPADPQPVSRSDARPDARSDAATEAGSGSQTDTMPIRREATDPNSAEVATKQPQSTSGFDLARLMAAMGIVLGLILLARWGAQKLMPGTRPNAPGPISVVSRTVIAPRQQLLLIRVGGKLLLVSDCAGTMSRLTEITDADEIALLLGSTARPAVNQEAESDLEELPAPNRGFGKWFGRARETFAAADVDNQADPMPAPRNARATRNNQAPSIDQAPSEQRGRVDLMVDDSPPAEAPPDQVAGDIQQLLERIRRVSEQVKTGRSS